MIRRLLIALAIGAVASAALLVADANHPTGTRGLLLIDKLGGQIRFVDPVSYKERSAFKVATNPHDFALTADRKTAYVPLYGDGVYGRNPNPGHEVVIVDVEAAKMIGSIDVAPYRAPHGIQIDANGTLYVCSDLDRKLLVIDSKTRKVTHAIDTEGTSHWIGILPDGSKIYATNKNDGPDGKYLLTMNLGSASINIFDAANLRGQQHTLTVGKDPMGFAFSADGKTVLVANHGDGSVSVVDLTTKHVTGRFQAGTGIETLTYY
jgi:YVTN family beta-propeller protein